jgi:hypothetical protein
MVRNAAGAQVTEHDSGAGDSGGRKFKFEDTPMLIATNTRRAAIFSNLLFSLPVAAGLLCSAISASAQSSPTFTVPFAFSANHLYLPAGNYQVLQQSDFALYVRNIQTGKAVFLAVRPQDGVPVGSRGRLVFERTGSRNHLTQVWIPGRSSRNEMVVRSRHQEALAKQTAPKSTIEVAAK